MMIELLDLRFRIPSYLQQVHLCYWGWRIASFIVRFAAQLFVPAWLLLLSFWIKFLF